MVKALTMPTIQLMSSSCSEALCPQYLTDNASSRERGYGFFKMILFQSTPIIRVFETRIKFYYLMKTFQDFPIVRKLTIRRVFFCIFMHLEYKIHRLLKGVYFEGLNRCTHLMEFSFVQYNKPKDLKNPTVFIFPSSAEKYCN